MNRYSDIRILKNKEVNNGSRYYRGVKYPEISLSPNDIYVITTEGDKLDVLAQQFYGDKSLWWVLSIANIDLSQNSLFVPVGSQLRIPSNIQDILSAYDRLNN
tara:strand:- start:360 stop:668 length:309 start_codon:yes stop_codon:yes gene_type:complete